MSESPVTVAGYTISADCNGELWCYVMSKHGANPKQSAYIWPTRETAIIAARVDFLSQGDAEPLLAEIHERIATLEGYMHRHDERIQKLERKKHAE